MAVSTLLSEDRRQLLLKYNTTPFNVLVADIHGISVSQQDSTPTHMAQ